MGSEGRNNDVLLADEELSYPQGERLKPLDCDPERGGYEDFIERHVTAFPLERIKGKVPTVDLVRALAVRADVVGLPISIGKISEYLGADVSDVELRLIGKRFRDRIRKAGLAVFDGELVDKDGHVLRCLELGWMKIMSEVRSGVEGCLKWPPLPRGQRGRKPAHIHEEGEEHDEHEEAGSSPVKPRFLRRRSSAWSQLDDFGKGSLLFPSGESLESVDEKNREYVVSPSAREDGCSGYVGDRVVIVTDENRRGLSNADYIRFKKIYTTQLKRGLVLVKAVAGTRVYVISKKHLK